MSFFKNLFGNKKDQNQKTPTIAECIVNLREIEILLQKKIEHLNGKIVEAEETAKQNVTTRKSIVTVALNRKIRLEQQVDEFKNNLMAINEQIEQLESVTEVEDTHGVTEANSMQSSSLNYYALIGLGVAGLIGVVLLKN